MSTMTPASLNGRMKKTLAFQLDRLDSILDGLAEALQGAVGDAVKETVGQAARDAVKVALEEAMAQTAGEKPQPAAPPLKRFWNQAHALISRVATKVKNFTVAAWQKVRQLGARYLKATVLPVKTVVARVKSRTLRWGMMLGAVATWMVSLLRRDKRVIWWGAGILVSTMLLESFLGTLGTLVLGGAMLYLITQQHHSHPVQPRTVLHVG